MESPNTKTFLLLQAHFSRLQLPCSDYYTDLKSVLDQTIRVLQAMIDVSAENGWLATTLQIQSLMQMVIQGRWAHESSLLALPFVEHEFLYLFKAKNVQCVPQLLWDSSPSNLVQILRSEMDEGQIGKVIEALKKLPKLKVDLALRIHAEDSPASFSIQKHSGNAHSR